jgi:hypothetical protein
MTVLKRNPNRKRKIPSPGRPQKYSQEIADYICQQLMIGRSIVDICKDSKVPSIPTVFSWLSRSSNSFREEFLKSYMEAREIQAEVLADQILSISDNKTEDYYIKETVDKNGKRTSVKIINEDCLRSKTIQIDSRKWLAAHLLPTKFSDRVQLTGAAGKDLIPSVPTKVIFNFVGDKEEE